MKKFLYFDCFSGISGDMVLGALIHLGADPKKIREKLDLLGLGGYELLSGPRERSGIHGVDARVFLEEEAQCPGCGGSHGHPEHRSCGGPHSHHDHGSHSHQGCGGHGAGEPHGHHSSHDGAHDHGHGPHSHRSYADICALISESSLSDKVKETSLNIFRVIGEAESRVHQVPLEEVRFHEVGAVDSIVDIVGSAIALELLGTDSFYCSPVHDGQGTVLCRHGEIPVPVPAVMELLKESGIRLVTEDVNGEMATPTGVGILKGLGAVCRPMPESRVLAVGYGFGKRETGRFNALRVVLGEEDDQMPGEKVLVIESNLDDESGEILGYTMDLLLRAGALDVFFTPIYMKKCRPAVQLSVLCRPQDGERLSEIIFRETSTLGVRFIEMDRRVLEREIRTVETEWGPVRFKISGLGDMQEVSPEYEDCARIARERGMPLSEVYDKVADVFV
ncbi:MAG: nickel pincer cofactor biosynthesis protein LarC [Bacillota bacterium]|nr:nickel pincer cofactor biosynthesis protein LarC [Bacillota bacterium]